MNAARVVLSERAAPESALDAQDRPRRRSVDLIPATEAQAWCGDEPERMQPLGPQLARVQDLPLCFPGRACVDVPPGGAQAMYLVADLTPVSPGIAAALWAGLGIALVLMAGGLRRQWRGSGLRPWLVLLSIALVLGGAVLAWSINAWLGEAELVYGGADGRPAASTPTSIVDAWPLVQSASRFGMGLGALALFLMLNTTVVLRRRAAFAQDADLP